jgi:hypothetical protein
VASPRLVRTMARIGLGVYAASLIFAGVRAVGDAEQSADAALVPLVLATMHLGHGAGLLLGAKRHGVPLAALACALGGERWASALVSDRSSQPAPQRER